MIKIGDKVRFLNDVGGGVVKNVKSNGIALVEDEDGFEIPCLISDLVAIETNEHNVDVRKFDQWRKNDVKPKEEIKMTSVNADKSSTVNGKQYLSAKTPSQEDMDENLEARVVRLEMQLAKISMRLERLEDARAAREKEKAEAKQQNKKRKEEELIVDLHSYELLESTSGMSAGDIKRYQVDVFNKTMSEHIKEKGKKIVFIHGKGNGVLRKAVIDELKYKYKSCEYQDASFQQYGFGATMVIIH